MWRHFVCSFATMPTSTSRWTGGSRGIVESVRAGCCCTIFPVGPRVGRLSGSYEVHYWFVAFSTDTGFLFKNDAQFSIIGNAPILDRDLCTTGQGEVRAGAWGTSLITSCAQKGMLERDLETPCVGVAVASCQAYVGPALGGVFSMRDALDCSQLQAPRHPAQGLIQSRHQHRLVKLNSASCDFFFFSSWDWDSGLCEHIRKQWCLLCWTLSCISDWKEKMDKANLDVAGASP